MRYTFGRYSFFSNLIEQQQQKSKVMYSSFEIGDILKSNKFKWVYKIINIKNGVATLEDINKNTVRVRFTLSALAQRVKNGIFAHRPQM